MLVEIPVKINSLIVDEEKDGSEDKETILRKETIRKKEASYRTNACEAIPLIFRNFVIKMGDHLLLGDEHDTKISPAFNSPIILEREVTSEYKTSMVKSSPSFGMLSLFSYQLKKGYMNKNLKKNNKIYCSHILSLILALPIMVLMGQYLIYFALISYETNVYNGTLCGNTDTMENKIMMSGISIIYFIRSCFLWDSVTHSLSLAKMNRIDSITSMLDKFQEFSFTILVYGANMWIIYQETDIRNMILDSMAMEFLMMLDNEFEDIYFKYMPGSAEDIYDTFVSYKENRRLLSVKKKSSKCFKLTSVILWLPYKILTLTMFVFPVFCFFMIFIGPICK
jgi:hypothetical protein